MSKLTVAQRMNLPWVESPFFPAILAQKKLTSEQRDMVTHYNQEGFLLLRNQVSHELIDRTIAEIEKEYPANVGEQPSRHQDLWKKYKTVKEIASQPHILEVLELLYDRKPIPFQTLNFKFGTQQRAHSDTIHSFRIIRLPFWFLPK